MFGILGAGNLGNDASMESVLDYLRRTHAGATVEVMSSASRPECDELADRHGIAVAASRPRRHRRRGGVMAGLFGLEQLLEAFRIAAWVRRQDVVIVPGAGVLETTLPVRPWHFPYELLVLCTAGKLFRTRVALVAVGASSIHQRSLLQMSNAAARLAFYRSYRDQLSRDAMHQRGLDTTSDEVYADLVFALPGPAHDPGDPERVALGVMSYSGANEDRGYADQLRASYTEKVKRFAGWLVDGGRHVTLIVGDSVYDREVVQDLVAHLRERSAPKEPPVSVESVSTPWELMRAIQPVSSVVATRYHNVITALTLGKPTIAIGYSAKFDALMADMKMSDFCQSAKDLDVDRLEAQFTELEARAPELRRTIRERSANKRAILERQFAALSAMLGPSTDACPRVPPVDVSVGAS